MTAETLPVEELLDLGAEDDVMHITCCDPDTSLCGEDLDGEVGEPYAAVECADCIEIDECDRPCTVRLCRMRRLFRRWFR